MTKTKAAPKKLAPAAPAAGAARPDRAGSVMIGGHFSPDVRTELKMICARENTTMLALLTEGINLVLAKRKRPKIAGRGDAK